MNLPSQLDVKSAPNCWQCLHFAVSWDPKLPYSCKLMGFKSRGAPSLEVLRADGRPCRGFAAKQVVTPAASATVKPVSRLA